MLKRALEVQEIYLKHKKEDIFTKFIYETYIAPFYFISIGTFYKYLSINAKKELREMGELPGQAA